VSAPFATSKNWKRTTDAATWLAADVSKTTLGTNDAPLTLAAQLEIFTGASG